jgi:Na+/H+ antiporter NhaD/arsenite permease-like protein
MKPGPLEIILIIVVVIAVAVIVRIAGAGRRATQRSTPSDTDTTADPYRQKTSRARGFLNKSGLALILAGIIGLLAAVSLFRWILQSYLWAVIIIVIGLMLVLLSRKRR